MAEPFTSQPDVDITARSSSYDKNIQKIIDLNRRLRGELEGVKSDLESMNEEFDKASQSIDRMIASLRRLPGIKGRRASGGGISFDSDSTSESNPRRQRALAQAKELSRIEDIYYRQRQERIRTIKNSTLQVYGLGKSGASFSNLINLGFGTLEKSLPSNVIPFPSRGAHAMQGLGNAGAVASRGISGVGASSAIAATGVIALATGLASLVALMLKLGSDGAKAQLTIANSQKVLGTSFKDSYNFAKKLNHELGIAVSTSMKLVSSVSQLMKSSGMSTDTASYIGRTATIYASNIAAQTGANIEAVTDAIARAIATGEDTLGQFGIHIHDNAVKAWMLQTRGIDAFNVAISESNMQKYRFLFLTEMMNRAGYNNYQTNNSLAASLTRLKNTWASLVENAQAIFIPVFQAVVTILEKLSSAVLKVVNGFRELMGYDPILPKVDGVNQAAIDSVQAMYSQYRKLGDELDRVKGNLHSFDELENISGFEPALGELSDLDMQEVQKALGEQGRLLDKTKETANVYSEKLASGARRAVDTLINRLPQSWQEPARAFFNISDKTWEEMTKLEKLLNNPWKATIELVKAGDATVWDFIKAAVVGWFKTSPIYQTIQAALEGDPQGVMMGLIKLILGMVPATKPIVLAWRGYEMVRDFFTQLKEQGVEVSFPGMLAKLKDIFSEAAKFLGERIASIVDAVRNRVSNAWDTVKTTWGNAKNFVSNIPTITSTSFSLFPNLPRYDTGGIHQKAHVAVVHPNELTLPLDSAAGRPAYQKIANELLSMSRLDKMFGGNGQTVINYDLGSNNTLIADGASFNRLVERVHEKMVQNQRFTGPFNFNAR